MGITALTPAVEMKRTTIQLMTFEPTRAPRSDGIRSIYSSAQVPHLRKSVLDENTYFPEHLNYFPQLFAIRYHALLRKVAREGAARAHGALNLQKRRMALQDVLHDGKPEARTAGRARASGIGAVEALRQTRNVLRLDADAGIRDREMSAVVVRPPAHLNGALCGGVFRRIVDEVGKGRMDLRLAAQ